MIHRKSDVRKKGKTRGWEMMLSYSFETGVTTGFVKGTGSSDVASALDHVRACAAQVGHPLLLPVIMLSYKLSPANDQRQREARDWTRRLENAVSLRDEVEPYEQYFPDGLFEFDGLNRDLVECHGHVMWKRPQAYWALVEGMQKAMGRFHAGWIAAGPHAWPAASRRTAPMSTGCTAACWPASSSTRSSSRGWRTTSTRRWRASRCSARRYVAAVPSVLPLGPTC